MFLFVYILTDKCEMLDHIHTYNGVYQSIVESIISCCVLALLFYCFTLNKQQLLVTDFAD